MKKFFLSFLLVLPLVCENINSPSLSEGTIRRCENDEVVCYITYFSGRVSTQCKFKEN